jgi:DNA-binding MarR family transcriptional regulator
MGPSEPPDGQRSEPLPAELSIWLSFLLRQAALRVQDRVIDALAAMDLRPPHNTVLSLLAGGPLSQTVLSARTQTDRTTMVAIVDELEALDLVTRRRNPRDRRAHEVTMTEKGAAMLARSQAAVTEADAAYFAALRSEERSQLRSMLLRLIAAHDATHPPPRSR